MAKVVDFWYLRHMASNMNPCGEIRLEGWRVNRLPGAMMTYTGVLQKRDGEWVLLFYLWPAADPGCFMIPTQNHIGLRGILEQHEGVVNLKDGDKLIFTKVLTRSSGSKPRRATAQLSEMRRISTGSIYTISVNAGHTDLKDLIGVGDYFVEVVMKDERYNRHRRFFQSFEGMGKFEKELRTATGVWDDCKFGELRGILTGVVDQSAESQIKYSEETIRTVDEILLRRQLDTITGEMDRLTLDRELGIMSIEDCQLFSALVRRHREITDKLMYMITTSKKPDYIAKCT